MNRKVRSNQNEKSSKDLDINDNKKNKNLQSHDFKNNNLKIKFIINLILNHLINFN